MIAIGNSGDRSLAGDAARLLEDPSPLVRGAAVWALAQLLPRAEFVVLAQSAVSAESDSSVVEEWRAA
jgi:epoxyqueuosine reductase